MDVQTFLARLHQQRFFDDQIVHVRTLPERPPVYADVPGGLHPAVAAALAEASIHRLYAHQAEAVARVRAGESVVIVTGTASGKTLCYSIPVVETVAEDPLSTALFLYPTKALAQDQLRALGRFQRTGDRGRGRGRGVGAKHPRAAADGLLVPGADASPLPDGGISFLAGAYDGDTPQSLRRKLRDGGSIILTNPDMLHQGILPQHARWNRFFTYLRYVVVDEAHAYRGVFGSHLANVVRRLERACRHYGSAPQFICCSATIANPKEHAERITGREMSLVSNDGSPRGRKQFVMWNPPPLSGSAAGNLTTKTRRHEDDEGSQKGFLPSLSSSLRGETLPVQPGPRGESLPSPPEAPSWRVGGDRRSPLWEAVHLMVSLVQEGVQTIAFVRTRLAAELLFRNSRDLLRPVSRRLAESVHAYRGGYLPGERREIERRLAAKEILGVASTNALELGIDIGSLDACILVGYPGTIASLWQQAGRAGRGHDESVVFLVAQNAPIDQYLMTHSEYLFARNPEQAIVDPDNPHIAAGHLQCAAYELPLSKEDADRFGPYGRSILELLEEDEAVRHLEGHWYWSRPEFPAAEVNLRNISGVVYTIQDDTDGGKVIGTLDEVSAFSQLHDNAVYLHGAETHIVRKLDLEQNIAHVERRDLDYYTQSVQVSQIRIDGVEEEGEWRGAALGFGEVTVTTSIPMFKKIRFHSRDSLGFERLELPPQTLETTAFWLAPPEWLVTEMREQRMNIGEALIGIANALVEVAPMFVMCDPQDIGVVVDASCLGRDALFFHDRYPGGMGYARRCLGSVAEMMETVRTVIRECACEDGCPSCVGSAVPAFAMTDLDSAVRGRIPDKAAARWLLEGLLGHRR
ncbi:MAG: DEAD/DEAH box helicase [Armatimonadetes bacterium]|nr:DEAD/DEAH box helicase [Armatimonadota bacterium]